MHNAQLWMGMKAENENPIVYKSKGFALDIIRLYQTLVKDQHEFILSKQLLRSGTSIGANIKEAIRAQSKADFISKMSISLKEASESEYWLELMVESKFISENSFKSLINQCRELIRMLTAIINRAKCNQ